MASKQAIEIMNFLSQTVARHMNQVGALPPLMRPRHRSYEIAPVNNAGGQNTP